MPESIEVLSLKQNYSFVNTLTLVVIIWWSTSAALSCFMVHALMTNNARIIVLTSEQRVSLFWYGILFMAGPIVFGFLCVGGIQLLEWEARELLLAIPSSVSVSSSHYLLKLGTAIATSSFLVFIAIWIMIWRSILWSRN